MTLREIGGCLGEAWQSVWSDIQVALTEPVLDWPIWITLFALFIAWNLIGAAMKIGKVFHAGFGDIKGDYVVGLALGTIGVISFFGLALDLWAEPQELANPSPLQRALYSLGGLASLALMFWSIRKLINR